MYKLKLVVDDPDQPDSFPFPGVHGRRTVEATRNPATPTPDSIRMVEHAMRDAEMKFDRLRRMLGYGDDFDRPRAA